MVFAVFSTWLTTLSLVFGGCCSNAITLEQLTSQHPSVGSVLTFFQFLILTLHGLPKFLIWTRFGPRLRPRRVPITAYLAQVALFYFINLLNNAAFAYHIPMAVHIIFRSAGLVITMLLGWLISKKKYNITQIISVLFVTFGVVFTTLSAQSSSSKSTSSTNFDPYIYGQGIGILTLALVLAGFLGLTQDWTYSKYGRPTLKATSSQPGNLKSGSSDGDGPAPWQESMFYLHFLALPMFIPLLPDLVTQMHKLNTVGRRSDFDIPLPIPISQNLTETYPLGILPPYSIPKLPVRLFPQSDTDSLVVISQDAVSRQLLFSFSIPQIYLPLILNTLTQLLCAAGVNRLTTRVTALTVTLVLVVRKAVSLIISVIGVGVVGEAFRDGVYRAVDALFGLAGSEYRVPEGGWSLNVADVDVDGFVGKVGSAFFGGSDKKMQEVDMTMMWAGAALVMLGTVGYTIGSRKPAVKEKKE